MRLFIALPVLLAAGSVGSASADDLAERLIARVHGAPVECPADVARWGAVDRARCVTVDANFKTVKKTLEMYARPAPGSKSTLLSWLGEWSRDGEFRVRTWLEDGELVRVAFDESRELFAVQPRYSCLSQDHAGLPVGGEGGMTDPRKIRGSAPGYPSGAKRSRTTGTAVVQLVVQQDGTVGEACVLYARPPGAGFGKAALRSVGDWRFEPVYNGSDPIDALVSFEFEWRAGSCSYVRTTRPMR